MLNAELTLFATQKNRTINGEEITRPEAFTSLADLITFVDNAKAQGHTMVKALPSGYKRKADGTDAIRISMSSYKAKE